MRSTGKGSHPASVFKASIKNPKVHRRFRVRFRDLCFGSQQRKHDVIRVGSWALCWGSEPSRTPGIATVIVVAMVEIVIAVIIVMIVMIVIAVMIVMIFTSSNHSSTSTNSNDSTHHLPPS